MSNYSQLKIIYLSTGFYPALFLFTAKYNLKVGANYDSSGNKIADINTTESGYGLQDEEMKGYVSSGQQRNGTIAFSSSKYWNDTYTPHIF